ncbi:nuclease-related domain-containing protein [Streptomyces sioyaensis]|uniref:nuclease-related domain-containing protein n=1 Tax=Streptomyces sioyaensis TaxID=67364 RepID=UPI003D728B44
MSIGTFLLVAAVLAWLVWGRRPSRAGRSAAARARQLRTPLVRLAELAGVQTVRGRQAAQFAAGAVGERRTGRLLFILRLLGWTVLHDLALPTGRANVDHLVVSPRGVAVVVDSKLWDGRCVRAVGGRLLHGDLDVTDRLRGLRHEAETVSRVLGVPVISLVVMHGASVDGGALIFHGIRIVPAQSAVPVLRGIARRHRGYGYDLGRRAARALKPYGRN